MEKAWSYGYMDPNPSFAAWQWAILTLSELWLLILSIVVTVLGLELRSVLRPKMSDSMKTNWKS